MADLGSSIAMWTIVPIVATIGVAILTIVLVRKRLSASGVGLSGRPTKERRAKAVDLETNGRKARATILAVQPTGMIMNHINIECQVTFRLDYIDGGGSMQGVKRMMLNQTAMPRVGDVWPAWVDRVDASVFGVGQLTALDQAQIPLFREFGIPHPLDQPGAASAPTAATAATSSGPPAATVDDPLASLERLAALHRSGALTDAEFAAQKAKLLA